MKEHVVWSLDHDKIVAPSKGLGPVEFLQKLQENDDDAWLGVKNLIVEPVLNQKKFAEIAKKWSVYSDDVFSYLYHTMMSNNRIAKTRAPEKIKALMQKYVRGYIYNTARRERRYVSLDGMERANQQDCEIKIRQGACAAEVTIVDSDGVRRRESYVHYDEKEIVSRAFSALWRSKTEDAFVFFLSYRMGLSSKEILQLVPSALSEVNVRQMSSRTRKALAARLKKYISFEGART